MGGLVFVLQILRTNIRSSGEHQTRVSKSLVLISDARHPFHLGFETCLFKWNRCMSVYLWACVCACLSNVHPVLIQADQNNELFKCWIQWKSVVFDSSEEGQWIYLARSNGMQNSTLTNSGLPNRMHKYPSDEYVGWTNIKIPTDVKRALYTMARERVNVWTVGTDPPNTGRLPNK